MSGEGVRGNREVSPEMVERAGVYGARDMLSEEGGPWGNHGFPHGSEPEASDRQGVTVSSATWSPRSSSSSSKPPGREATSASLATLLGARATDLS